MCAASIVYWIGTAYFIFDKSQAPYLRADELADIFGVGQKTAARKARQIRDILNVNQVDPKWWRPLRMRENPFPEGRWLPVKKMTDI